MIFSFQVDGIEVAKYQWDNQLSHYTWEFEGQDLILRRGQPFQLDINLARPYDKDHDKIYLEFRTGELHVSALRQVSYDMTLAC